MCPEALDLEQARYLEGLRSSTPELALVQNLAGWFAGLVREGEEGGLTSWLREAGESELSEIRTFARGIRQDEAAVRSSTAPPRWSRSSARTPWTLVPRAWN